MNKIELNGVSVLYQVFENNTVFRNALRNFISSYKP